MWYTMGGGGSKDIVELVASVGIGGGVWESGIAGNEGVRTSQDQVVPHLPVRLSHLTRRVEQTLQFTSSPSSTNQTLSSSSNLYLLASTKQDG